MNKEEIEKALRMDNNFENILKMQKQQDKIGQLESDKKTLIKAGNALVDYIEQLESDKQKLIEKLEEDVINITKTMQDGKHCDDYSKCRLKAYRTKTKEILSILKGENHE